MVPMHGDRRTVNCPMQEARLQQLNTDLRSELSSGSLAQLKEMISDFMQQLTDSMSRQGLTHPSAAYPLRSYPEQLGDLTVDHASSSAHSAPHHQLEFHAGKHHVSIDKPREQAQAEARAPVDTASLQQQSLAQSMISEDEIELDLPESRASSVIEEEAGLASRAAESVAESVSEFQYSMDFEGSVYKSPMSGIKSPMPGQQYILIKDGPESEIVSSSLSFVLAAGCLRCWCVFLQGGTVHAAAHSNAQRVIAKSCLSMAWTSTCVKRQLCYSVPCCAVLCCAVLCCAVLYSTVVLYCRYDSASQVRP